MKTSNLILGGALALAAAGSAFAAPAAAPQPEFQTFPDAAKASGSLKPRVATPLPAPNLNVMHGTLGSDGAVHVHCTDEPNPALRAERERRANVQER